MDEYVKTEKAAKILCVSMSKLWKMCHRREIPYYKIGRLNLFKVQDLEAYIQSNRVLTTEELQNHAEDLLSRNNAKIFRK